MKTIINPPKKDWEKILQRPTKTVDDIENTVNQIFDDVKRNGDAKCNVFKRNYHPKQPY